MNKYKVRANGKTSYDTITKHECGHQVFGFWEHVLWQLTPDKNSRGARNGDFGQGTFLGVICRTAEYIIGTDEGIFNCGTAKARSEESAYDPKCIDYITVPHDQYILEDASSQGAWLIFAESSNPVDDAAPMPRSGFDGPHDEYI